MYRKALTSGSLSTHGFFGQKTSHPPLYFFSVYWNDFSVAHEISAKLASSASVVLKMPLTW